MVADARVLPLMWLMQRNYSVMQIDYTPKNFLLLLFPFPFVSLLSWVGRRRAVVAIISVDVVAIVGSTVLPLPAVFLAIYYVWRERESERKRERVSASSLFCLSFCWTALFIYSFPFFRACVANRAAHGVENQANTHTHGMKRKIKKHQKLEFNIRKTVANVLLVATETGSARMNGTREWVRQREREARKKDISSMYGEWKRKCLTLSNGNPWSTVIVFNCTTHTQCWQHTRTQRISHAIRRTEWKSGTTTFSPLACRRWKTATILSRTPSLALGVVSFRCCCLFVFTCEYFIISF